MKIRPNKNHILLYRTAKDTGDRLSLKEPVLLKPIRQMDALFPSITIDATKTFQTIEGFGGSFTDASAITFYSLPMEVQNEIITRYFDVENGIGYSLCKTHIKRCDFTDITYCYTQVPNDILLESFSIQ